MGTTKGYTINYFVNVVRSINKNHITDKTTLFSAISPRYGSESVKALKLNTYLNGRVASILNGTGKFADFGKTPKERLLKALRLRKQNGFV